MSFAMTTEAFVFMPTFAKCLELLFKNFPTEALEYTFTFLLCPPNIFIGGRLSGHFYYTISFFQISTAGKFSSGKFLWKCQMQYVWESFPVHLTSPIKFSHSLVVIIDDITYHLGPIDCPCWQMTVISPKFSSHFLSTHFKFKGSHTLSFHLLLSIR